MGEKKQEEKPAEEKERSMSLPMKKSTNNKRNIPPPNRYFTQSLSQKQIDIQLKDNLIIHVIYKRKKHLPTIKKIPDELWYMRSN